MTEKLFVAGIIILVYWIWCYIKFRRRYVNDRMLLQVVEELYKKDRTPMTMIEYAGGLMLCQRYADALVIYEQLDTKGLSRVYGFIPANIAFCKRPHPFMNGAKNLKGSYWHNFVLKRLGGRRNYAISNETLLKANVIIRQSSR